MIEPEQLAVIVAMIPESAIATATAVQAEAVGTARAALEVGGTQVDLLGWSPVRTTLQDLAARDEDLRPESVRNLDRLAGIIHERLAAFGVDPHDHRVGIGALAACSLVELYSEQEADDGLIVDATHRATTSTARVVSMGFARFAPLELRS